MSSESASYRKNNETVLEGSVAMSSAEMSQRQETHMKLTQNCRPRDGKKTFWFLENIEMLPQSINSVDNSSAISAQQIFDKNFKSK